MRCIFCKDLSDTSRSVEHIIPESLGNKEHVLPPGVVCDGCNNYFSRRIEGPLLEHEFFVQARFRNGVENKRGSVPLLKSVTLPFLLHVGLRRERDRTTSIGVVDELDAEKWSSIFRQHQSFSVIFPVPEPPDNLLMARFLGKVGLEALARRFLYVPGWLDEITDKKELDELRRFVRCGDRPSSWPVKSRHLYDENHSFPYPEGDCQILHEYTFLYTPQAELYFILAVFGYEFAINMGGPEVDGYMQWLAENDYASPLYLGTANARTG